METNTIGAQQLENFIGLTNSLYRILHCQPLTREESAQRHRDIEAIQQATEEQR